MGQKEKISIGEMGIREGKRRKKHFKNSTELENISVGPGEGG